MRVRFSILFWSPENNSDDQNHGDDSRCTLLSFMSILFDKRHASFVFYTFRNNIPHFEGQFSKKLKWFLDHMKDA